MTCPVCLANLSIDMYVMDPTPISRAHFVSALRELVPSARPLFCFDHQEIDMIKWCAVAQSRIATIKHIMPTRREYLTRNEL